MVANLQLFRSRYVCCNTTTAEVPLYLLLDHAPNITFEVALPSLLLLLLPAQAYPPLHKAPYLPMEHLVLLIQVCNTPETTNTLECY
jgi:hypothetical protein